MRKYISILIMLLCVGFISCDDGSNDVPAFKIAGNEMDITAVGGKVTVTLSMDGEKATSDQTWCVPSISGKTVELTLEKNPSLEGRTALVTVTKGAESIAFPVTQPGNIIPTPDSDAIEFDAHGGEIKIPVRNALPFRVELEDDVTWVTARVDGSALVLNAETNYTRNSLTVTGKLISEGLESEFTVTQSGIVLTPEKTSVLMYNAGDEVTLKVESTLEFNVSSDQEWLEVTKGDGSILLKAGDNSGKARRTATVKLTSEGLTATVNITQRPPIYTDYLGSWTLIGMNGNTPFTYNISLTQATANSTYTLTGWSKSGIDEDCPLEVVFNGESGEIEIYAQENLGVFTQGADVYDVCFYGMVEVSTGSYQPVGGNYVCYSGMLQRDGTVEWQNGEVTLGSGDYVLSGSMYWLVSQASGGLASFNADKPFMSNPVMVKAAMTRSRSIQRSVISTEKSIGVMIHQN